MLRYVGWIVTYLERKSPSAHFRYDCWTTCTDYESLFFLQVRIDYGHYIHVTIYCHFSGTPTEVQNIFGGSIGLNKAWSRIPINFLSSNFCYKKIKIKEHLIVIHVIPIDIISQNCFRTVSKSNLFMCFKILTSDFIAKSSAYI